MLSLLLCGVDFFVNWNIKLIIVLIQSVSLSLQWITGHQIELTI